METFDRDRSHILSSAGLDHLEVRAVNGTSLQCTEKAPPRAFFLLKLRLKVPLTAVLKVRHSNQRSGGVSSEQLTRTYFQKLAAHTKLTLLSIYKYDFESFGYDYSSYL